MNKVNTRVASPEAFHQTKGHASNPQFLRSGKGASLQALRRVVQLRAFSIPCEEVPTRNRAEVYPPRKTSVWGWIRERFNFSATHFRLLTAMLCPVFVFLGACHREIPVETAASAKVEGDTVVYAENAPQRAALIATTVESQTNATLHFTGRVVWDEDSTVRIYSSVLGRVHSLDVKPGDQVAPGTPLAQIDSPDLGQALADVRKAEADLTLAGHTLARLRDLLEHGAVAQKEVESAEDTQAGAQAEQQRANAKLKLYGAKAGSTDELYSLCSPIAGVVVERNVNPGQEIRPDSMMASIAQLTAPAFVVTDPHRLWVVLDATELDIAALQPGQPLRIASRAYPGRIFKGKIESVGASLDAATRTLKVRGFVENPELLLKAEMYVTVEADSAEPAGAVSVVAQAVFLNDNQAYVYVETTAGHYTRRAVHTEGEANGRVLIRDGLQSSERVVVEGALLLEAVRTGGGAS